MADALLVAWRAADFACSKRLAPFLPELVPILERHGEIQCSASARQQLATLSASTIDRLLQPVRLWKLRHPFTTVRSPTVIKGQVPIRTFGEWQGVSVGHLQADLVALCGVSTFGFYLTTLVGIDGATGWTECVVVWGKGQSRVGGAMDSIRRGLPFPLLGLHSDNGGEFLNYPLVKYCRQHNIEFTRGRPYKKNDQAYVEQRNWQVVRRLVGYDRYATRDAYEQLNEIYWRLRVYSNFFQPISKLISKERMDAKVRKRYDEAKTPYQRLQEARVLDEATQQTLAQLYQRANPMRLLSEMRELVQDLKQMAILDPMTREILCRKSRVLEGEQLRQTKTAG